MNTNRPPISTNPSAAALPPDSMMANAKPSGTTVVPIVEEILARAYRRWAPLVRRRVAGAARR
jgi:hypothetical protein